MTRLKLPIFLLVISHFSFGQLAEPLYFREKIHDFGDIKADGGPAVFEFTITNRSTRPISILTVKPSCGCTTPDWTREQIAPGSTGFVKASFEPKGRPGYFNKTLAVTTDWDGNPVVLQIKGNVIDPSKANDPSTFSVVNGSLRFKSNAFNLDKVFINREPDAISFPVYNSSKHTIHFTGAVAPKYLKAVTPKRLAPNEASAIKIIFDAKMKGQYGFVSENIELKSDDKEMNEKSFSVYATVEEFFPKLSEAELAKAPVLVLSANVIKFGN